MTFIRVGLIMVDKEKHENAFWSLFVALYAQKRWLGGVIDTFEWLALVIETVPRLLYTLLYP